MRTSDAAAKRRLILAAAGRLLVRSGFQDVVLDDVAREAGIAKGTLFLYYKSKEELVAATLADLSDQMGRSLEVLLASSHRGLPLLRETIRVILEHFERKRDFLFSFGIGKCHASAGSSRHLLIKKFKENSGRLVFILERCAEDGILRSGDLSYGAFALAGLCRSAVLERMVMGSKRAPEAEAGEVLRLFLDGMGAKRGRR